MSVSRENGAINIKVKLLDGEIKTYDYSLVEKVQDTPI